MSESVEKRRKLLFEDIEADLKKGHSPDELKQLYVASLVDDALTRIQPEFDAFVNAARDNDLQTLKALMDAGISPNAARERTYGSTALMFASQAGHMDVVQSLLKAGADPNIQNINRWTALMFASQLGHMDVVQSLLKVGANPNIQNINGVTAIMFASGQGLVDVVQAMLDAGANPNLQNDQDWTALMLASKNGHVDVVQALLNSDANPNMQNRYSETALMNASANHHLPVVQALLYTGADYSLRDAKGETPLMRASGAGHLPVVQALLNAGSDPNLESNDVGTALMRASNAGHLTVVQVLLNAGARPNVQSRKGYTALMRASNNGHMDILKALLKSGANPNLQDQSGRTALEWCRGKTKVECREILKEAIRKYELYQMKKEKQSRGLVTVGARNLPLLPKDVWRSILKRRIQQELCVDLKSEANREELLIMAEVDFEVPKKELEGKSKQKLCEMISGLLSIGAMYSEHAKEFLERREMTKETAGVIEKLRALLESLKIQEFYYDDNGVKRTKSFEQLLSDLAMAQRYESGGN